MKEKRNYTQLLKYVKGCIKRNEAVPIAQLAMMFDLSRSTVHDVLRRYKLSGKFSAISTSSLEQVVKKDEEKIASRQEKRKLTEAIKQIQLLKKQLALQDVLSNISQEVIPHKIEIVEAKGKKEAIAVAMAGDWHVEEEVHPEAIGNVNKFNLDIAVKRIDKYFERSLKLLNMCRKESYIKRMVVAALGDFMTGWIHEDLISDTTPPEALLMVFEQWVSGLQFWLENADLDELIIVCVCGNHARITSQKQYRKVAEKNYEWLLYQFLAKWFAQKQQKTKIKFLLPTGYFNWITIYGKRIRVHHGDQIRYYGGIGGLHIPLRKAIAQWNKANRADLDLLGHWHTRTIEEDYVVNGSLIGYNEFAQAIKADFERPKQAFFILHPYYGKTAEFSIVLD